MKGSQVYLVGTAVGIIMIVGAVLWVYFSAPYIVGANIGAGLVGLAGVVVTIIFGGLFIFGLIAHKNHPKRS